MKDELEDFVRKNRGAFDDKEPSEKVWRGIESSMFSSIPWYNSVGLWRAAAVLFMALSAYLLYPKADTSALKGNKIASNEMAMKEFMDVESFYVKQISEKVELIDEFGQHEGMNGFTKDFQQLEAMYNVLKEEMKVRPSQKVKDALVLNLLVQIDLLNQHLHKLEKGNKEGEPKPKVTI